MESRTVIDKIIAAVDGTDYMLVTREKVFEDIPAARDIVEKAITEARINGDAIYYRPQYKQFVENQAELWIANKNSKLSLYPLNLLHGKPWAPYILNGTVGWEQLDTEVTYYYIPPGIVPGDCVIPVDYPFKKILHMFGPYRGEHKLYMTPDRRNTYRICKLCHDATKFNESQVRYYKKRKLPLPSICRDCAKRKGEDLYV